MRASFVSMVVMVIFTNSELCSATRCSSVNVAHDQVRLGDDADFQPVVQGQFFQNAERDLDIAFPPADTDR